MINNKKLVCLLLLASIAAVCAQTCEYKGKDYSVFTGATDWTGTDGSYTYKFNICRATVTQYFGSDCVTGMQSHQLSGTFCTANIAGPSNAQFADTDTGVSLTYNTGGRVCGGTTPSAFVIFFDCDADAPEIPPATTFTVEEPTVCNYQVRFPTSFACGGGGGGGGGGSDGGLSGGSVFLIIFFVGGFVYLAGGVLYNTKQLGRTGLEAIPNIEFWREFPTYVKDGVSFAIAKCRGTGGSTGGQSYSSVP